MSRRRFIEQERRLAAELGTKFRGSASVNIDVLHFPFTELREEDEKNTQRLKKMFRKENGCRDWEIFNHIPAVIDQHELDDALARSGVSSEQLLRARDGHLELDFRAGFRLRCLRGRHRVLAATAPNVLPPGSQRWTVDLFLSGKKVSLDLSDEAHWIVLDLHDDLRTTLIEEYSCEKKPDDGEIYRKIREYQGYGGGGNPYFETRWWALLYGISDRKPINLKQILQNDDFRARFDFQLDVPGLGGGMKLGVTHKMFPMGCDEVSSLHTRHTFQDADNVATSVVP